MSIAADTIFALASPPGRSGVAVIRVSGESAWSGLNDLIQNEIIPHKAALRVLKNPRDGSIIDHALVLGFKAPASYTGEDIIEYQIHGGRAVIDSLLAALSDLPFHRPALPGEFTRRAFEHGKMDLTAAEAVADLIDAETQSQKIQALSQMEGALSRLYNDWSARLKKVLAYLEADLEFPDEELPEGVLPEILPLLDALSSEITEHLNDSRRGERLRDGIQVVVIGAPNTGKSSLINALAQRDVAIVSDVEGTTRDVIEVHLDLGGYPVILADTAGLRPDQIGAQGQDSIESEGIRRALLRAQEADIKLLLFDATQDPDPHTLALIDDKALIVMNKIDCYSECSEGFIPGALKISVTTGQGLDDLIAQLIERVSDFIGTQESPSLTRQRHRNALEEAQNALIRAQTASLPELTAEDVRLSIRSLGSITGKVDVEDLLDVIFNDFCIGK